MSDQVSFDISQIDTARVSIIVDRAAEVFAKFSSKKYDRLSARMDLIACHANGCPMDFEGLSKADDTNIAHDVFGIARHLDRETGKLTGHFLPRFAMKQAEAA